jgi:cellulose synthase/poly-beta-1,6-N-acetylglucosamine synthase-like glycosyltransferase
VGAERLDVLSSAFVKELLGDALVTTVVLLLPATMALFTVRQARRKKAATSPARAAVAALVVALLALSIAALLGARPPAATGIALGLGGSVLAWLPVARHWAVRGLVAWAVSIDACVLYLTYMALWTATADLGLAGTIGSIALLLIEAFVLLIGAGYLWELVDVLARHAWTAYVDVDRPMRGSRPFVSIHVPTHNEPPHLVIATVDALLAMEYDDFEVLVVDNNTDDPALWEPVARWCESRPRARFLHLADWPGYKSGALNEALRVSDRRAEVVGIVDADYIVEPDFLARCAPLFDDPEVAFVQTPQDYREWDAAPYFRRLYYSYGYFFDVSQRSRNERNGAIFGGTMGLIRRSSLETVGGWDEWCITEDAELSLRLLRAGGRGVHVDQTFGRGIMPLTFEALKAQRFRWCFGGIQILRLHWRSLLPGPRTETNRLTLAQRWAYLAGGMQWFGDLAGLLFTGFLLAGAFDAWFGSGVVVRRLSGLLIACVLVLVVLGAVRALALVRRTTGASWGESLGAFGMWLALGWTVALASFRGLFAREGVFLRTPKVKGELRWTLAIRGNPAELAIGTGSVVFAALAASTAEADALVVAVLLLVQGGSFLAAPINSLAAIRSDLPEELRRRRRDAVASWGAPAARRGGLVFVATSAVFAALVAFAGPVGAPQLPDLPDELSDLGPDDDPAADDQSQRDGDRSTPGQEATTPVADRSKLGTPVDGSNDAVTSDGTRTSGPGDAPSDQPADGPTDAPTSAGPAPTTAGPAPTTAGPAPTTPTQRATPTQTRPTGAPSTKPTQANTDQVPPTSPGGGRP